MDEKIPSLLKCVRRHCLECSGGSSKEVEVCPITHCNLYPYRLGKSLTRKGKPMTEEQKVLAKKRMEEYHAKRKEERGLPE